MNSNVQLLFEELTPNQANMITESSKDGKNVWLNGIFMQADIKNRNGRIYPLTEVKKAVEGALQKIKETNGLFGELDHPNTLTINLDRISHIITDMRIEGSNVIGKAKLLNTPMGNIAKELVENGVIGVSSRGAGNVGANGEVSDFTLVTVDLVATPSAPNAYPSTVMESLEYAKNGKAIMDLAEAVRHDETAQKYLKEEIEKWLATNIFKKIK